MLHLVVMAPALVLTLTSHRSDSRSVGCSVLSSFLLSLGVLRCARGCEQLVDALPLVPQEDHSRVTWSDLSSKLILLDSEI